MNFCPFCGQKLPGDSAFCPYCGRPLAGAAPAPPEQTAPVQAAPAPKKRRVWAWVLAAVLVLALAAGGFAAWQAFSKPDISTFSPSVLYLEGFDEEEYVVCSGSGFFIENGPEGDPLLVTNYHVIEGCAGLDVWDSDFENCVQAKSVVAYDQVADLAILRCEPGLDVAPLTLAGEEAGIQGDAVYAIGYPLGIANTLSNGIISSRYYDEYDVDVLQITTPISEGSSGGALLNEDGLVVGVTVASYVDGENMNLAIAAHQVSSLLANAGEEMSMEEFYEMTPHWRLYPYIPNFDAENYTLVELEEFEKNPKRYVGQNLAIYAQGYLDSWADTGRLFSTRQLTGPVISLRYPQDENSPIYNRDNRFAPVYVYGRACRETHYHTTQWIIDMYGSEYYTYYLDLHAYEYYA